jgi:hypothetical protein
MDSFEAQKEHYYKQADSLKVAVHIKRYYETLGAEYSN